MFEWLKRTKVAMPIQVLDTRNANDRTYTVSSVDETVKQHDESKENIQFEDPNNTGILRLEKLAIPTCLVLTYANDPDGDEESTVEFVNSSLVPAIVLAAMHGERRLVRVAVYSELVRSDDINQVEYDMRRYTIPDEILNAMNSEEGGVTINRRGFIVKAKPTE